MWVLHSYWITPREAGEEGGFFLWAECADGPQPSRDRRKKKAQPHPFTLSPEALQTRLPAALQPRAAHAHALRLWLPTDPHGPVPSPELLHEWETSKEALELLPWTIQGLLLSPPAALTFLGTLLHTPLPPGLHLGQDSRCWQLAFSVGLELLARQLVRPLLVEGGKQGYEARWQLVVDGEEVAPRLAQLAAALPPVCRAASESPDETLPPRAILESFLNHLADAAMRRWGNQRELFLPTDPEPAHAWLRALLAPTPAVKGSVAALQHLAAGYRAWTRALTVAGDPHYRIAFRLEAPVQQKTPRTKKGEAAWQLHYLLQARDDASLLVPAEEVWKSRGSVLAHLDRRFDRPQERMLAALGYAARLFEPLRRSLEQRAPSEMTLTTEEAYAFLRHCAPQLQQSGFGLLVPPWWNKPGARLGVRLKLGSSAKLAGEAAISPGHMALDKLVRFRWELALGETELTREEFDALVALKSPLVQIRGQWVQLDPEQIEAAIHFWEQQEMEGTLSLPEALQMGLAAEDARQGGLAVEGVELDDWLQNWLGQLQGEKALEQVPLPAGLHATLRPYQVYGYSWLHFARSTGLGVILADDMGLGKCILDTNLVAINGLLVRADTLWDTYAGAPTFDGEGYWAEPTAPLMVNAIDEASGQMVEAPVRRLYRQVVRERLRTVHLADGSQITITQAHRLLTDKGWTNEFQVGDYVCVPARLPWEGVPVDPDLACFVAWQIAEGYELTDRGTVTITQKNEGRLIELRQTLQRLAERYQLQINQPGVHYRPDRDISYLTVNSRAYQHFLEERGYQWGSKSAEKEIPPFIMQGDQASVAIFLRAYFDGEASVVAGMRSIEISSASFLLMQQLSLLLRRFGIWLRIATKKKRATNGSGIYRTYYIGTLGGNALRHFAREIGFSDPEKQARLDHICQHPANSNVEGIPTSGLVAEIVAKSGLPSAHFGLPSNAYIAGTQEFSRPSLERVVEAMEQILSGEAEATYRQRKRSKWTRRTLAAYETLDHAELQRTYDALQRLLTQEVFYCPITRIEELDHEGWVYDLEVAEHHNFVANHILCHNTVQTLTLVQRLKEEGEGLGAPILLICPTSVVTNWAQEGARFTPDLKLMVHQGPTRLQGEAFVTEARAADMVLTSYALARRDAVELEALPWFGVVLDEAQNIKNPKTKQARLIRQLGAAFRLALTGTPVENRLSELWSIMHFLNPGFLGSQKVFRQNFAIPIEKYGDEAAARRLRTLSRPFILRRLKSDPTVIQDLPDKQEMKVYCHLSEEQVTLYEAVVRDALSAIEEQEEGGIARRGLVLSMLMQLKQVCNHPAQYLHETASYQPFADEKRSGKLQRLHALLEELLAEGDRALIFSQFTEMAELLRRYIQEQFGVGVLYLHGGVPAARRAEMVRRFQEEAEGPPIFLLSLKAGGTGLNLTRANHVFHFDRWWNPAVEDQATDRAFRIGQTQSVLVHKFVCQGTLEERIDQMMSEKKALAERIVGTGENWLTEMSTADLRELVRLRPV